MVQTVAWTAYRVPNSLPSDTEDSVLGTEWHQEAIGALADMLRDVAVRRGAPWGVCEGIALIGLQHQDGADYDPRPDVMVLERPLPRGDLAAIHLADVGAPLFVMEAASNSTKGNDLDDKRLAYAAIGVREYLVFDPAGGVLSTPLLAWRLDGDEYARWQPDGEGWWHSAALDVSFRATQPFLGVRDRDGTLIAPAGQVRRQAHEVEQRLMAEAHVRAELEQRLMAETLVRAEIEQRLGAEAQERTALEQRLMAEAHVRAELEQRLVAEAHVRAELEQRLMAEAHVRAELEQRLVAEALTRAEFAQRLDAEALAMAKLAQRLDAEAQARAADARRIARLEEGLRQLQTGAMRDDDELTSDH